MEERERETHLVPLGYARQPYMGKENQYPVYAKGWSPLYRETKPFSCLARSSNSEKLISCELRGTLALAYAWRGGGLSNV